LSPAEQDHRPVYLEMPGDYLQRRVKLSLWPVLFAAVLTMLMLSAAQSPIGWSWLIWLALVPWTIAAAGAPKTWHMLLVSYLAGLAYYLANLYWLIWVTPLGYGALCIYLAVYFPLCGFILRRVYLSRRWPFTFVLPVVWVGQEYLRAVVMTGFPWFFLGHALSDSPRLIQVCDLFGVYSLTFLAAMVNGLVCDLLLRPLKRAKAASQRMVFGPLELALLTACMLAGVILYGQYRLDQGRRTITPGPDIAVVQEVIPQYVKLSGTENEEIFTRHLALTTAALSASAHPQLIVWPETMVPVALDSSLRDLPSDSLTPAGRDLLQEADSYDKRLRQVTSQNVSLLVGAPVLQAAEDDNLSRFNSALFYLADGGPYAARYDKMHLVPFGEVVPFKRSWPWLYRLLNHLTPYDYDYSLDAGSSPTVFTLPETSVPQKPVAPARFAVAICYEDVMPQVPRLLAAGPKGEKRIDFIINISNDGWFVRGGPGKPVTSSTELLQHLTICQFRAVENRVGIVRAVNTGISGFIKPDGSLQFGKLAGSLPDNPRARQVIAGFLTDTVYFDSRTSLYSRIGDTFAVSCTLLLALLLILGFYRKKPAPPTTLPQPNAKLPPLK